MKSFCYYICFALVLAGIVLSFGQCSSVKKDKDVSISGLWIDSNNTQFKNCYAIFSEYDGQLNYAHYLEFQDTVFVEHGSGTFDGRQAVYDVTVTRNIPSWDPVGTKGKHILELSKDGKTLRGSYSVKGKRGSLVFLKVR